MVSLLADVFCGMDNGHVLQIYIYVLSAAFYTVNYAIHLDHLCISFEIADSSFLWFQSSLSDHMVSVAFVLPIFNGFTSPVA